MQDETYNSEVKKILETGAKQKPIIKPVPVPKPPKPIQ